MRADEQEEEDPRRHCSQNAATEALSLSLSLRFVSTWLSENIICSLYMKLLVKANAAFFSTNLLRAPKLVIDVLFLEEPTVSRYI